MGIKIINTTARQTTYEASTDRQGLRYAANKANDQQLPQQTSHLFSPELFTAVRHNSISSPSESNNSTYNPPQAKQAVTQTASAPQDSFETAVAARVNSWFNSVHLPQEVKVRRESLMDQIRRGKPLRRVSDSNDRSAPKLS